MTNEQYITSKLATDNFNNTVYVVNRANKWAGKSVSILAAGESQSKTVPFAEFKAPEGAIKLTGKAFDVEHASRCNVSVALDRYRSNSYNGMLID